MNSSEHHPDPRSDAVSGEGEYRTLHALSVVTMVSGGLCFLALFKPIFWVVPLVVIVLGIASLRALATQPEKVGRSAALIGLALAIFFGSWGASRYFSRQQWLARHARQYGDAWVELVRTKQLRQAHQLHLRAGQRIAPGVTMDDYYSKHPYAQSNYDSLFNRDPLRTFAELTGDVRVELERVDRYEQQLHADSVTLRYRVIYERLGRERVLPLLVVLRREIDRSTGDHEWFVSEVLGT